jgi:hypothetical protein
MMEEIFKILLWLVILFSLSFALDNLWSKIFPGRRYRIFVTPGVVVHELSHALAGLLVGAKIKEINFFSSMGGYVRHTSPGIPVLGQIFISFAPILGGIGALLLFSWLLGLPLPLIASIQELFLFVKESWLSWQFWLFVYLVISVSICLTPSSRDFKNALFGVLVLFLLGATLYYFNFSFPSLGIIIKKYLGNIVMLGVVFEFLALLFTLPFYLIHKIRI